MSTGQHKYVVMQVEGIQAIFVFPKFVDHDRMVEACAAIRFGSDRNWERKTHAEGDLISAGFVTNGVCHGRSETLDLESRGDLDTALLRGASS